jgi:hypothetical protein
MVSIKFNFSFLKTKLMTKVLILISSISLAFGSSISFKEISSSPTSIMNSIPKVTEIPSLGTQIGDARRKAKLSRVVCSEKVGLTEIQLRYIESDLAWPDRKILARLSELLNVEFVI